MKIVKLLVILGNLYLSSAYAVGHQTQDKTLKGLKTNLWNQGLHSPFLPYAPEVMAYLPEEKVQQNIRKELIPELEYALDIP